MHPLFIFMFRWVPLDLYHPPSYTRYFSHVSLDFVSFSSWIHYIWSPQSIIKILIQLLCYCYVSMFIQGRDAEIKFDIIVICICCSTHSILQLLLSSTYQFIQRLVNYHYTSLASLLPFSSKGK